VLFVCSKDPGYIQVNSSELQNRKDVDVSKQPELPFKFLYRCMRLSFTLVKLTTIFSACFFLSSS
jgi:hypothetical protein